MSTNQASKWIDGDSARAMTNKYNDSVDILNDVPKKIETAVSEFGDSVDTLQEEMDKLQEDMATLDLRGIQAHMENLVIHRKIYVQSTEPPKEEGALWIKV